MTGINFLHCSTEPCVLINKLFWLWRHALIFNVQDCHVAVKKRQRHCHVHAPTSFALICACRLKKKSRSKLLISLAQHLFDLNKNNYELYHKALTSDSNKIVFAMAALVFKVKSKNGQQILKDLTSESTVGELKMFLSSISDVSIERVCVLCGYPPKAIDTSDDSKTLGQIGLKTGETLIVEEKALPSVVSKPQEPKPSPVPNGDLSHETLGPCRPGILMKKVVPSDNSCLFTSIGKYSLSYGCVTVLPTLLIVAVNHFK